MKGFINVLTESGLHRLMPVEKIFSVFELENGKAFIGTQSASSRYGFETLDSYEAVLDKINEAMT